MAVLKLPNATIKNSSRGRVNLTGLGADRQNTVWEGGGAEKPAGTTSVTTAGTGTANTAGTTAANTAGTASTKGAGSTSTWTAGATDAATPSVKTEPVNGVDLQRKSRAERDGITAWDAAGGSGSSTVSVKTAPADQSSLLQDNETGSGRGSSTTSTWRNTWSGSMAPTANLPNRLAGGSVLPEVTAANTVNPVSSVLPSMEERLSDSTVSHLGKLSEQPGFLAMDLHTREVGEINYALEEVNHRLTKLLGEFDDLFFAVSAGNGGSYVQNQMITAAEQIAALKEERSALYGELETAESIQRQKLLDNGYRDATLWDLTGRSIGQGWKEAELGREWYDEMHGRENNAAALEEELAGEDYLFVADGPLEKGVQGAMKLFGQGLYQGSRPQNVASALTAAGIATAAGAPVPLPEEVISAPAAALTGWKLSTAEINYEIEAGFAYQEMLEHGVSKDTARTVATAVGVGNAALELLQLDELIDAFWVLKRSGGAESVLDNLGEYLVKKGVRIGAETGEELLQEGVTIGGTQLAGKWDTGKWPYDQSAVWNRLKDTAGSSLLSFGMLDTGVNAVGDFFYREPMTWTQADEEVFLKGLEEDPFEGPEGIGESLNGAGKSLENEKQTNYNTDDAASLSLRFVSNRDNVYKNMENVQPLDGYEDVACHADPYLFGFVDPDTGETIQEADAKLFVKILKESGKYHGGPIRLIACESGKVEDGLAQQVADELGEAVLAPTKIVYTNSQGYMVLADNRFEGTELLKKTTKKWDPTGWVLFEPKEG